MPDSDSRILIILLQQYVKNNANWSYTNAAAK